MRQISKKEPPKRPKAKIVKSTEATEKPSEKKTVKVAQSTSTKTSNRTAKTKEALSGVKKRYLKSAACKVTFRLPKEAAPEADKVTLVGDFNKWSYTESEMKRMKNGDFQLTMELSCNREYRFRYLIDSSKWENDWCADKYAPNPFGGDDSVVVI